MDNRHAVSLVLNAHQPFVRHPEYPRFFEERWLFDAITDTYLPLLRIFDRLDADHVPFHLAIVFSPTLCHMLRDPILIDRYLQYLDRQIDFGAGEIERTQDNPRQHGLACMYHDNLIESRVLFTERYEKNILRTFDFYHKKGRLELLTTAATYAFFPFYAAYPEAVQAQIEIAVASHREIFGRNPQGFWLPEMGWSEGIDDYLRAYNFSYTMVDTHGVLNADPPPLNGSFEAVKSPAGIVVLPRDLSAAREIWDSEIGYPADAVYRDFYRDIGYDLPAEMVGPFLEPQGVRTPTGFKYWAVTGSGQQKLPYDPELASVRVLEHVEDFLKSRSAKFSRMEGITGRKGYSLCAYNADLFGHWWYEGPEFLEILFRQAAKRTDLAFVTPFDYIKTRDVSSLQTVDVEFSSWGTNGYAERWLDSSNDWMYRHVLRSIGRMIELAERFPTDGGLKERALNQAAREILIAQSSDWAGILHQRHSSVYARSSVEEAIRNFTTIYESLGSNYISTEWLTTLERRHNIFPNMNYRVFRKKN